MFILIINLMVITATLVTSAPSEVILDVCSQGPIMPGKLDLCEALFQKFTYNSTVGECQRYIYGGCFGSANLFDSLKECKEICPGSPRAVTQADESPVTVKEKSKVCYQRKMRGVCRALIPSFYYHQKSKKCRQFRYGGCGGNGNNFKTLEECRAACE